MGTSQTGCQMTHESQQATCLSILSSELASLLDTADRLLEQWDCKPTGCWNRPPTQQPLQVHFFTPQLLGQGCPSFLFLLASATSIALVSKNINCSSLAKGLQFCKHGIFIPSFFKCPHSMLASSGSVVPLHHQKGLSTPSAWAKLLHALKGAMFQKRPLYSIYVLCSGFFLDLLTMP